MTNTTVSIIISVATAVGKTFLIGVVGYVATLKPKKKPFLPVESINMLSRLSFNILILPMIFSGVGSSVTLESLGTLWMVVIASFLVIFISFMVATILAYLPCFRIHKEEYFGVLRTAICFPNIVAIPILLFPALCEHDVFHEFGDLMGGEDEISSLNERMDFCFDDANAVVFAYFFGWSILFWSFGNVSLRNNNSGAKNVIEDVNSNERSKICGLGEKCYFLMNVLKDIISSPGFIVLILAFIAACIQPLQNALFLPGGSVRVIGSTLEALSDAGATFATIVVAATLADHSDREEKEKELTLPILVNQDLHNENMEPTLHDRSIAENSEESEVVVVEMPKAKQEKMESEEVSDKSCRSSDKRIPKCVRRFRSIIDHPTFKVQVWHVLSRLFVTPAVVFGLLMSLGCEVKISPIAKLVLLVNSALPGALVVVMILQANGYTKAASVVSQTYLPSYTLSVVSVAVWTSIGMVAFSDSDSCS